MGSFQPSDGVQYGRDENPLIMVFGSISVLLVVVLATAHGRLDGTAPEVFSEIDDYFSNLFSPLRTQEDLLFPSLTEDERINDIYFTTIVGVTSGLMVFVIVGIGFLFHRARKNAKAAEDVEYPAYGVTGPGKDISPTSGDRKLAQNAQLYHYQHQKNQMIAFDGQADSQRRSMSDNESEDGEEGDYTVYECPGLAPTGEMEVRNPMFEDDVTPKATSK